MKQTMLDVVAAVVLAAIIGYALVHSRHFAGATIDDAFITFRHATDLVEGQGFTCNAGERIEGTSSPLWLLEAVMGSPALPIREEGQIPCGGVGSSIGGSPGAAGTELRRTGFLR